MPADWDRVQRDLEALRSQVHMLTSNTPAAILRELDQVRGDIRQLDQKMESTRHVLLTKISADVRELHERIDEIPKTHLTQREWAIYRRAIWLLFSSAVALLIGGIGLKLGLK